MKFIEIDKENMQRAIASIPENKPVFMLNLLKYKAWADYGDTAQPEFVTGQEAYFKNYIPAFNKIAATVSGIRPFYIGHTIAGLVAPDGEIWDNIALIEYPSFAAFRFVVEHPDYATLAEPHRLAALEDWRLIVTSKISLS